MNWSTYKVTTRYLSNFPYLIIKIQGNWYLINYQPHGKASIVQLAYTCVNDQHVISMVQILYPYCIKKITKYMCQRLGQSGTVPRLLAPIYILINCIVNFQLQCSHTFTRNQMQNGIEPRSHLSKLLLM